MWFFSQSSGNVWSDDGKLLVTGYSGHGEGKNNPDLEAVKDVGPIPKGLYRINKPYDSNRVGKFALPLEPIEHDCLGRTYFRIHGDSVSDPGNASHGCIVVNRQYRETIFDSGDFILKVIE